MFSTLEKSSALARFNSSDGWENKAVNRELERYLPKPVKMFQQEL